MNYFSQFNVTKYLVTAGTGDSKGEPRAAGTTTGHPGAGRDWDANTGSSQEDEQGSDQPLAVCHWDLHLGGPDHGGRI